MLRCEVEYSDALHMLALDCRDMLQICCQVPCAAIFMLQLYKDAMSNFL